MSEIRVTYSGLISLIVTVVSLFTSLGFSIIITRSLSQSEFGIWGVLGSIMVYGLMLDSIVGYWSTRESARNENSQKTAISFNQVFSVFGMVIFFISAISIGILEEIDFGTLLLILFLVPIRYLQKVINAINLGWKPQNSSYGIIISEFSKIILGIIFIYFLQMGLVGLIVTIIAAYSVNIIIQMILAKQKIKNPINFDYLKKWIKGIWIPMYARLPSIIHESDKVLVMIMMDSVIVISYFAAAMIVASIVSSSTTISKVAYGKLLGDNNVKFLKDTISLHFLIAIPFVATSIVFSKVGMIILNPVYEAAYIIVIVLALRSFVQSIRTAFGTFILGVETVDKYQNKTKDFLDSSLFKLPTIDLIQTTTYVTILFLVLYLFGESMDYIDIVYSWAIILLIVTIPTTIIILVWAKKKVHYELDVKRILKFLVIGVFVFGLTYLLIPEITEKDKPVFNLIVDLLPLVIISIGGYFGFTILVDKKTRELTKLIKNIIK